MYVCMYVCMCVYIYVLKNVIVLTGLTSVVAELLQNRLIIVAEGAL